MTVAEEHDPDAEVWKVVSNLELKAFTREEIHDALINVAETLRPEDGFVSESRRDSTAQPDSTKSGDNR